MKNTKITNASRVELLIDLILSATNKELVEKHRNEIVFLPFNKRGAYYVIYLCYIIEQWESKETKFTKINSHSHVKEGIANLVLHLQKSGRKIDDEARFDIYGIALFAHDMLAKIPADEMKKLLESYLPPGVA